MMDRYLLLVSDKESHFFYSLKKTDYFSIYSIYRKMSVLNRIIRKLQWNTKNFAKKLYYRKCGFTDPTENPKLVMVAKVISPLFSKKGIFNIYEWGCGLCDSRKTKDWVNISSIYSLEKETIANELLEKPSLLKFEGHYFTSVSNPDQYLTNLYGDYMKLPPIEKRVPAHAEVFTKYK